MTAQMKNDGYGCNESINIEVCPDCIYGNLIFQGEFMVFDVYFAIFYNVFAIALK